MDEEGRRAAHRSLELAELCDDPDLISCSLDALGGWALCEARYGAMEETVQRRIELVARLSDVTEICDVYAMGAWSAFFIGDYNTSQLRAERCVGRAEGIDAGSYIHGLVWRVCARFMVGDWDGALGDQDEIERLQSEDSRQVPPPSLMRPYGYAMFCRQLRGDFAAADRYLAILRRFHDDPDMPENLIGSRAVMARSLAHRGSAEEARSLLRLEEHRFFGIHLEAYCDVAPVLQDWDEVQRIVPLARREVQRGGLKALSSYLDRLEGRAAAAAGDHERATELLRSAYQTFGELGAPWEKAVTGLYLAESLLGSESNNEGSMIVSAARDVFARLASVAEMERAEELLNELR